MKMSEVHDLVQKGNESISIVVFDEIRRFTSIQIIYVAFQVIKASLHLVTERSSRCLSVGMYLQC